MLVNDKKEIGTSECHTSLLLFGCRLNSSKVVRNSVCIVKPFYISGREEVGFQSNSNVLDTHYSNVQEVLKTWCT